MQRVQELSPIELVEMFVTVFCFLKDSSEVSQTLLDDFRTCGGYVFLSDFLLKSVVCRCFKCTLHKLSYSEPFNLSFSSHFTSLFPCSHRSDVFPTT